MTTPEAERKQFEKLDRLAGRSAFSRFSMSPNDVLVQVSLPLILILAIATRLFTSQDQSPLILELWKQQVILRVENVLNNWENESSLSALPDFSRIQWAGAWPDDQRYRRLCHYAASLDDIGNLKQNLLAEALKTPVSVSNAASRIELKLDDVQRDYALKHIEQRCLKWKSRTSDLQWSVVARVLNSLPVGDPLTDRSLEKQMANLSAALGQKGYPLMNSVVNEYRKKDAAR